MLKVKVTTVGSSTGVVLPKEALHRMKVKKGDTLYLIETQDGYELTPYDQEFAEQVESAERVMGRFKNALHELAK
jgi:putative addiction module antidote